MINLNPFHFVQQLFHGNAPAHPAQVAPKLNPTLVGQSPVPVLPRYTPNPPPAEVPSPQGSGGVIGAIKRGVVGAEEALNPFDAESKGNNLINTANQQYHFTPQFKGILDKANPAVYGHDLTNSLLSNNDAIGNTYENDASRQHHIDLTNTPVAAQNSLVLVHEGLNTAWEHLNPQQRSNFLQLAQKTLPASGANTVPAGWTYGPVGGNNFGWRDPGGVPGILPNSANSARDYLKSRYSNYKGVSPSSLDNLTTAPQVVQREVLPYLSDYYMQTKQSMPQALKQYYSQFYGAKQAAPNNSILSRLVSVYKGL